MANFRPTRVAVVDDDRHLRESIKDLLETVGYVSDLYETADHFLKEQGYLFASCILADVRMPGTSGLEMLRILRQHDDCPPILIMTSYADERTRSIALASGASAFLVKPVEGNVLIAEIERALNG